MHRHFSALLLLLLLLATARAASAQQWDDTRTTALVRRATDLRAQQMADPLLRDYKSRARGFLTFLVQLGEGFRTPPFVVKADEIAVEAYWTSPGRSKQVIVGMRDTLLLPGDIGYYHDRYGIVQNNFPDLIRLGDGRDVRDVPHPISEAGLRDYSFRITDSLAIVMTSGRVDVYQVSVRPRDDSQPRVIGRVFIDAGSAAIVRMEFTFTRAAFLDDRNEKLTVTLENGLIEGRFWLPHRQELDLTRAPREFDYPARTIIRARWEVCCYEVNLNLPAATFVGPEIVRSSDPVLQQYRFDGEIVTELPADVRILTPAQVQSIRSEAEQLVRARALSPQSGTRLAARRASDFVRANRVEGLAIGAGANIHNGAGFSAGGSARYGIEDHQPKGRLTLTLNDPALPALQLFAERDYRDITGLAERSLALNTVVAPTLGSDYTDYYDVRAVGASLAFDLAPTIRSSVGLAYERHSPVQVNFEPLSGEFQETVPAWRINAAVATATLYMPEGTAPLDMKINWRVDAEGGYFRGRDTAFFADYPKYGRVSVFAEGRRAMGDDQLYLALFGGIAGGSSGAPPQRMWRLGGPVSAPGYEYHELTGEVAGMLRVEYRTQLPFFSISLGRYGNSPAHATVAPFVTTAYLSRVPDAAERAAGFYPAVGVTTMLLFDLLRIDIARGTRDGRWTLAVDIMREFWSVL